MFSFFWMILVPVVMTWLYGFVTVSKYQFALRRLDLSEQPLKNSSTNSNSDEDMSPEMTPWSYAALWPLALGFEPDQVKGLLYPSLWMWPRFREEWPALKAEVVRDRRFKAEMRRKNKIRENRTKHGQIMLADAKEDFKHQRDMALIDRETEEWREKWLKDHPPALGAGEKYDPTKTEVDENQPEPPNLSDLAGQQIEVAITPEQWCLTHNHWVKPKGRDSTSACRF